MSTNRLIRLIRDELTIIVSGQKEDIYDSVHRITVLLSQVEKTIISKSKLKGAGQK